MTDAPFNPFATDEQSSEPSFEQDTAIAEAEGRSGDKLIQLFELAKEMREAQRRVMDATSTLRDATAAFEDISERRLPALMEQFDQESFPYKDLSTGIEYSVKLDKSITASIACEHRERPNSAACQECKDKAYAWVTEMGEGGVIKHEIYAPLGLMNEEQVDALIEKIQSIAPELEIGTDKKIEPATFKALMTRLLEAGKTIPDSIKTTRLREAKFVKKPAKRTAKKK